MPIIYTQEHDPGKPAIMNTAGLSNQFGTYEYQDLAERHGISTTGRKPLFVTFRGDIFLANCYSRPLIRHQTDRVWVPVGIAPPSEGVQVAKGSGSGGSSGDALCFITFLHKQGARVLCESARSNISGVSGVAGEGFVWTGIQDSDADYRVNYVRGYRSMNGADYRMAWEAPYGLSTITENRNTPRLSFKGPDPDTQLPPPVGVRYAHVFGNRMFWANSPEFPFRLWFSPAGKPQYTSKLGFLDTRDRETINAIWKGRNELLVFCEDSCYKARIYGAGATEVTLEKLDSDVGCISQWGILEIFNRLWFPSRDGYWMYDGAFRYLMKDISPLWAREFAANEDAFREGWAVHDRNLRCMMWVIPYGSTAFENTGLTAGTLRIAAYYGDWERAVLGQNPQPDWTVDLLSRTESTAYSNEKGEVYFGDCEGRIRKQDATDDDDDGDTLLKRLIIRSGHHLFFEPGDDILSGKQIDQHWHYVESENNAWTLYLLGGDEDAWNQIRPDNTNYFWKADVVASLLQEQREVPAGGTLYDVTFAAKSVHFFEPEKVAGRGFTFEVQAASPLGMKYRGFGGMWSPGHAHRPAVTATVV